MLKPLNDRVVVRADEIQKETASGILLADSVKQERPFTGTVLSGNTDVSEGDRIVFSRYGFDEIELDGEKLCLVSASCILAII